MLKAVKRCGVDISLTHFKDCQNHPAFEKVGAEAKKSGDDPLNLQ